MAQGLKIVPATDWGIYTPQSCPMAGLSDGSDGLSDGSTSGYGSNVRWRSWLLPADRKNGCPMAVSDGSAGHSAASERSEIA